MNNVLFFTTLAIAIFLAIILIFFIITIIRYHNRYVRLQKERIHAEIIMQENERRRIAGDLHDSLGPLLSSVKLQISSVESANKEDEMIISKAGKHLDGIINNLREISYNLVPNTLERKGLTEAIQEFIGTVQTKQTIRIDFFQPVKVNVAKEQHIHIFRMLQEIIHNTIKHSKAKTLQIALGKEKDEIIVMTKDDGVGFDQEKKKKTSTGLGLKSIESRVEILNGSLILQSNPGNGTTYFIRIPVKPNE